MSFFDTSQVLDLPSAKAPVRAPSFGEAFDIGYEQQYRVDSPLSLEYELMDAWKANVRALERTIGAPVNTQVAFNRFGATTNILEDQGVYSDYLAYMQDGSMPDDRASGNVRKARLQRMIDINEQLKETGGRTFEDIFAEVAKMQQGVEAESNAVSGFVGTAGQLIGSIAGAFSERDPITLATLPIGGFGRTAAMRIATEMGIAGGVTALTDATMVNPNRAAAGLEERSVMAEALYAAAGAGVFQGAFEGIGKLVSRVTNAGPEIELDFRDDIMRLAFEGNQQSPRARAGLAILDDVEAIERASPYGTSYEAKARFIGELQELQAVMGNAPSTAIARVLPPLPFEAIERNADFELVKSEAPEVWAKVDDARARIAALDEEARGIQEELNSTDIAAAVTLVDPVAGARVAELSRVVNDLEQPEAVRAAADIEAQGILNRVGPDKIVKAVTEAEIPARQRLKRIPAERRAANKRMREAMTEADTTLATIKRDQDRLRAIQQASAVDLLGNAIGGRALGHHLRYETIDAHRASLTRLAETQEDRALAAPRALTSPEGEVDIGLKRPVPETFAFAIDGDGNTMTVREAFDDLLEDEKLDEAMRSCLL